MTLSEIKTNNEKPKINPRQMAVQNQANNNQNNGLYMYTYIPMNKVKTVQQK